MYIIEVFVVVVWFSVLGDCVLPILVVSVPFLNWNFPSYSLPALGDQEFGSYLYLYKTPDAETPRCFT